MSEKNMQENTKQMGNEPKKKKRNIRYGSIKNRFEAFGVVLMVFHMKMNSNSWKRKKYKIKEINRRRAWKGHPSPVELPTNC